MDLSKLNDELSHKSYLDGLVLRLKCHPQLKNLGIWLVNVTLKPLNHWIRRI